MFDFEHTLTSETQIHNREIYVAHTHVVTFQIMGRSFNFSMTRWDYCGEVAVCIAPMMEEAEDEFHASWFGPLHPSNDAHH